MSLCHNLCFFDPKNIRIPGLKKPKALALEAQALQIEAGGLNGFTTGHTLAKGDGNSRKTHQKQLVYFFGGGSHTVSHPLKMNWLEHENWYDPNCMSNKNRTIRSQVTKPFIRTQAWASRLISTPWGQNVENYVWSYFQVNFEPRPHLRVEDCWPSCGILLYIYVSKWLLFTPRYFALGRKALGRFVPPSRCSASKRRFWPHRSAHCLDVAMVPWAQGGPRGPRVFAKSILFQPTGPLTERDFESSHVLHINAMSRPRSQFSEFWNKNKSKK